MVPAGSTGEDLMKEMASQYPNLNWRINRDADVEELPQAGRRRRGRLHSGAGHRTGPHPRYYPELTEGLTLASKQTVAWAMTKLPDDSPLCQHHRLLRSALHGWLHRQARREVLWPRAELRFVDTRTFLQRAKSLLPKYQDLFQTHAKEIDWRLLAAISYQESHWILRLAPTPGCAA